MYEPFNSLVLVSSSTVKGCVHFLENYLRELDITLLFIKTVYFTIDVSGLTRIDTPRNAAERRVFFKKLENFGCGSLWGIWSSFL